RFAAAAGARFGAGATRIDTRKVASVARTSATSTDEKRLARCAGDLLAQLPVHVSHRHSILIHRRSAARTARLECGRDCDAVSVWILLWALLRISADGDGALGGRAWRRAGRSRDSARWIVADRGFATDDISLDFCPGFRNPRSAAAREAQTEQQFPEPKVRGSSHLGTADSRLVASKSASRFPYPAFPPQSFPPIVDHRRV